MARMYPPEYPADLDHESYAEQRLFQALSNGLPNSMRVFFGVRWLGHAGRKSARDGEADFVIIDPARGILVVEVKGGGISRDEYSGDFYSNGRLIKNPYQQAETCARALYEKLGACGWWPGHTSPFVGHAVAFPDIPISEDLGLDAPSAITMDMDGLHYPKAWLTAAFDYWRGQPSAHSPAAIDLEDLARITDLLSPKRDIQVPLMGRITNEQEQQARLTRHQFMILGSIQYARQAIVRGFAGTGKTVLACEHAQRLATQGMTVLLLCFNRALATRLRGDDTIPETLCRDEQTQGHVLSMTFHQFCQAAANDADINTTKPQDMPDDRYYNSYLPRKMTRAKNKLTHRFDAIIVDEAQDFYQTWWIPLRSWLVDPEQSFLCLFCDECQNLYRKKTGLPADLIPYVLTENCRNTPPVHALAEKVYRGDLTASTQLSSGEPVRVLTYETRAQAHEQLRKLLHHLHIEERIPSSDIVILAPHRRRGIVAELPKLGNFQLVSKDPTNEYEILTTTIHSFKGLESSVVILADITDSTIHGDKVPNLFYVGVTRATSLLIILCNTAAEPILHELLPKSPARN